MLKTLETDLQLWIFGKKLQGDRNGICSNTIHIEQVTKFTQISGNFFDKVNAYCTKKWSFPTRISSAYVTKSVEKGGFGHIY